MARAMSDADDGALLASGVGPIPWDTLVWQDKATYLDYADGAITEVLAYVSAWLCDDENRKVDELAGGDISDMLVAAMSRTEAP